MIGEWIAASYSISSSQLNSSKIKIQKQRQRQKQKTKNKKRANDVQRFVVLHFGFLIFTSKLKQRS